MQNFWKAAFSLVLWHICKCTWASLWWNRKLPGNQCRTRKKTSVIEEEKNKKKKLIMDDEKIQTLVTTFLKFLQLWRKIEKSAGATHCSQPHIQPQRGTAVKSKECSAEPVDCPTADTQGADIPLCIAFGWAARCLFLQITWIYISIFVWEPDHT